MRCFKLVPLLPERDPPLEGVVFAHGAVALTVSNGAWGVITFPDFARMRYPDDQYRLAWIDEEEPA